MIDNKELLIEIGGFAGISSGSTFEIDYSPPDHNQVSYKKVAEGILTSSKIKQPSNLDYGLLESAEFIIHWHTHPRPSIPSKNDFGAMFHYNAYFNQYFDKPVYYVLYLPGLKRSLWYSIEKFA